MTIVSILMRSEKICNELDCVNTVENIGEVIECFRSEYVTMTLMFVTFFR